MYIGEVDHHNSHKDKHAGAKSKIIMIECMVDDPNKLPEASIKQRFIRSRKIKGYSIKELALITGLNEATIINIEKGRTIPNIISAYKLSQALNKNVSYLMMIGNDKSIIYRKRIEKGLSQADLGKLCNLHQSTIKDYENGRVRCSNTLKIIIQALE